MIVYCDRSECVKCKERMCLAENITLCDMCCDEYEDITEGPDYQETYYTANERDFGDGKIKFRIKRKGKRVEWKDFVCFTNFDIREGMDEAYFTEKETGELIPLGKMMKDKMVENKVREGLHKYPKVITLPIYHMTINGDYIEGEEEK